MSWYETDASQLYAIILLMNSFLGHFRPCCFVFNEGFPGSHSTNSGLLSIIKVRSVRAKVSSKGIVFVVLWIWQLYPYFSSSQNGS